MIKRGSEQFSGYNKPKRTPDHPTKSHAVLAKSGEDVKLIRFGQQGVHVDVCISAYLSSVSHLGVLY